MDGLFALFLLILGVFVLGMYIAFLVLCFKFVRDVPLYLRKIAFSLDKDYDDFDDFDKSL